MPRHILIVDDDETFAKLLVLYLRGTDIIPLTALGSEQARELLDQHSDEIGLVLLDIAMPRLNGYELARLIRADARFADLPLVAVTARKGLDVDAQAAEAGIDRVVSKPVDVATIHALCRDAGLIEPDI